MRVYRDVPPDVAQASKPAVSQVSKPAECPLGIAAHESKLPSDSREVAFHAASALELQLDLRFAFNSGRDKTSRAPSCTSHTLQVWKPALQQAWKPALQRPAVEQCRQCFLVGFATDEIAHP